jgi:hypothetical protein
MALTQAGMQGVCAAHQASAFQKLWMAAISWLSASLAIRARIRLEEIFNKPLVNASPATGSASKNEFAAGKADKATVRREKLTVGRFHIGKKSNGGQLGKW